MDPRTLDLLDDEASLASAIAECELLGRRTLLMRKGRPVAAILSFDELTALEETVAITADLRLRAEISAADEAASQGKLALPEDLFVE